MKKKLFSIGAVCLIIFLAVSFTAATCTVTPGPVVNYYTQFVTNGSAVPVYIDVYRNIVDIVRSSSIIYSGQQGSVQAENGYYIRIRNASTGQYLPFNPPNTGDATYYFISSTNNFNISGGGWVSSVR